MSSTPDQKSKAEREKQIRQTSELVLRMKLLCEEYSNKVVRDGLKEFLGSLNLRSQSVFQAQMGVSQGPKVPGAPNPQKGKKARTPEEVKLLETLKVALQDVKRHTVEMKVEKLPKEDPIFIKYQAALAAIHIFRNPKGTEKAEQKSKISTQASAGVQNTSQQAEASTAPTQSVGASKPFGSGPQDPKPKRG